jgi:hypothetical protein
MARAPVGNSKRRREDVEFMSLSSRSYRSRRPWCRSEHNDANRASRVLTCTPACRFSRPNTADWY